MSEIRTTEGLVGSMGKRGGRSVQKRQGKNRGAGGSTGTQQEKGRVGPLELCRTISGNVDGKKGNAPETHGTRNGTHRDVVKVDMCVLNPAPRNPGWKWGRGGYFNWYQSQTVVVNVEGDFEQLRVSGQEQIDKKSSYRGVLEFQSRTYELEVKFFVGNTTPRQARKAGGGESTQGQGRAAEYSRLYQGQRTFQLAPEVEMTPPSRGRGRPRKTGSTRESLGPIRAMNAERTLTRRVVAITSSEEDVEVEKDPSEDSEWEEEPASSTGSGRVAGSKPEGEQKSPVRSG
uniref:Uncharacterized protein n=1 Tax=Brassica campestris TaxID=3711 RepID=M4D101_BRACM